MLGLASVACTVKPVRHRHLWLWETDESIGVLLHMCRQQEVEDAPAMGKHCSGTPVEYTELCEYTYKRRVGLVRSAQWEGGRNEEMFP